MGEQSIRVPDQEKQFASISGQASTAATALGKFMELTSLAKSYHDLENARKVLRTHSQMANDLRKMNRTIRKLQNRVKNTVTGGEKFAAKLTQAQKAYFIAKAEFEANRLSASLANKVFMEIKAIYGVTNLSNVSNTAKNVKLAKLGTTFSNFNKALSKTKAGSYLLKTGGILKSKSFLRGLTIVAGAAEAWSSYENSPANSTAGKAANTALGVGAFALVNKHVGVAVTDMVLPDGWKLSEIFHGTADVVSSYGEAIFADDSRALDTFHKRSMKGSYGKVLQASSEAGEYWHKKGVSGGMKEFVDSIKWWVSQK